MCRTIQSLIQTLICALQMITRIFMTLLLMLENMIRMLLQSIYNFISTVLQIISLIPICCIFLLTARMRCLLCGGGGGGCGSGGGGSGMLGCILSVLFFILLFKALKHYGLADKLLGRMGYARVWIHKGKVYTKPPPHHRKLVREGDSQADVAEAAEAAEQSDGPSDEEVKNYIFGDFVGDNGTTTPMTTLKVADTYVATENSKAGNLSTILYYLF